MPIYVILSCLLQSIQWNNNNFDFEEEISKKPVPALKRIYDKLCCFELLLPNF